MIKNFALAALISYAVVSMPQLSFAAGFEIEGKKPLPSNEVSLKVKQLKDKIVWYYPKNTSCVIARIRKTPDISGVGYVSEVPVKLLIQEVVEPQYSWSDRYVKVKINDDLTGYVAENYLNDYYHDLTEKNPETLQSSCFSDSEPNQMQARIDEAQNLEKKNKEEKQRKWAEEWDARVKAREDEKIAYELGKKQQALEIEQILKAQAPKILKEMPKYDFCRAYGESLRGEDIYQLGSAEIFKDFVKKEAARRKLKLNTSDIKAKQVGIGISACQLYASWGFPDQSNSTTGKWGEHIQHVYGDFGPYVYTENGRVTIIQN